MRTSVIIPSVLAACCGLSGLGGCAPWNNPALQEEAASKRSPVVGHPAPDFTLKNQDGQEVTLSRLRGQWVVLYFYPLDDTPGCTCQATEFTRLLGRFHDMNAKIYGISPNSPDAHQMFIQNYNLKLDLLSDTDHAVGSAYGAWVNASLGDTKYGRVIRSTFLVDPQGVIRYHWPEVIPQGHAERVRQKLQQLEAGVKP